MVLPITNHRNQDVEIKRFLKSCNCSRIEPPSLIIPVGQTREVRLILDLAPRRAEEYGVSVRDFEVGISPEVAGEGRSNWWTIQGRVRSALQSDPPMIDFGNVSELSRSTPVQKATITTFDSVRNLFPSCSSTNLAVTVKKSSSGKENDFDLVAALKKLEKGEIRCSIALIPELSDSHRLPARRIEVVGRIVSDVEASPPCVLFGAGPVGTIKSEMVTLRSLTGQSFDVTGIRCEGEGLSVDRAVISSNPGHIFLVKQKVSRSGEENGKVFFRIGRSHGKEEEVAVSVSYCGLKSSEE